MYRVPDEAGDWTKYISLTTKGFGPLYFSKSIDRINDETKGLYCEHFVDATMKWDICPSDLRDIAKNHILRRDPPVAGVVGSYEDLLYEITNVDSNGNTGKDESNNDKSKAPVNSTDTTTGGQTNWDDTNDESAVWNRSLKEVQSDDRFKSRIDSAEVTGSGDEQSSDSSEEPNEPLTLNFSIGVTRDELLSGNADGEILLDVLLQTVDRVIERKISQSVTIREDNLVLHDIDGSVTQVEFSFWFDTDETNSRVGLSEKISSRLMQSLNDGTFALLMARLANDEMRWTEEVRERVVEECLFFDDDEEEEEEENDADNNVDEDDDEDDDDDEEGGHEDDDEGEDIVEVRIDTNDKDGSDDIDNGAVDGLDDEQDTSINGNNDIGGGGRSESGLILPESPGLAGVGNDRLVSNRTGGARAGAGRDSSGNDAVYDDFETQRVSERFISNSFFGVPNVESSPFQGTLGPILRDAAVQRALQRHPRVIAIGDVHGCIDELQALLRQCDYQPGDLVLFLGDLVSKGPDSISVVQMAREIGAIGVRGNHDFEVIRWHEAIKAGVEPPVVGSEHFHIASCLTKADMQWMNRLPWYIASTDLQALFVHAGFVAGIRLAKQNPRLMMNMRSVLPDGTVTSKFFSNWPWARLWDGPHTVFFGHDADRGLQQYDNALGLDTGCVYGGRLTACILPERRLVSVSAKREYFKRRRKKY